MSASDSSVKVRRSAEDTLAIQELVVRYGYILDDKAYEDFRQIFTDDAVVDWRDVDPTEGPFVGIESIIDSYRHQEHPLQTMLVSHLIDNVSEDEAVVRSKALFPIAGQQVLECMYRDVVVRTPDGWRIKHKSVKSYGGASAPTPDGWPRIDPDASAS